MLRSLWARHTARGGVLSVPKPPVFQTFVDGSAALWCDATSGIPCESKGAVLPVMRSETLKQIQNPSGPGVVLEPGTKTFEDGDLRIIVSPPYAGDGWHLSFSLPHDRPSRARILICVSTMTKQGIIPKIAGWDFEPGMINRTVMHLREQIKH